LVILVLVTTIPSAAHSQLYSDIATEQELFAGFCLGRSEQELADWLRRKIKLPGFDEKLESEYKEQNEKLQSYLTARGYQSVRGPIAKNGVRLAMSRGREDETACVQQIDACLRKCNTPAQNYDQKCINECRDSNRACRTVARCFDEKYLPF
jgi:hypothetical protein